jgi:hypothetical protein
MSEEETKMTIAARLHERIGICGHCGERRCHGRSSNSQLPLMISADDVIWALSLDKPLRSSRVI